MNRINARTPIAGAAAVVVALLATGCSGDDRSSVQMYTPAAPAMNERFERVFEEAHPDIDLQITRGAADLLSRVDAEIASGTTGADIFMYSSQQWFQENEKYLTDAEYDADWPLWGIKGSAPTVSLSPHSYIVWNTDMFPEGFDSWDDLLAPEVSGSLGARESVNVVLAGYMQYLEDSNGKDFLPAIAGQDPKLYPSVIPLTQAVGSGEVGVGMMSAPATILELEESGAPIDYWMPEESWGVGFNAAILEKSEVKEQAQVVMDYFMTPEGQAAFNGEGYGGSPLEGVDGAIDVSKMEVLDAEVTTPDVISGWGTRFRELFG